MGAKPYPYLFMSVRTRKGLLYGQVCRIAPYTRYLRQHNEIRVLDNFGKAALPQATAVAGGLVGRFFTLAELGRQQPGRQGDRRCGSSSVPEGGQGAYRCSSLAASRAK